MADVPQETPELLDRMRFALYADHTTAGAEEEQKEKGFRWSLCDKDGLRLAHSARSYSDPDECLEAISRFSKCATEAPVTDDEEEGDFPEGVDAALKIYRDEGAIHRCALVTREGEKIAELGDGYLLRENLERVLSNVKGGAGGAWLLNATCPIYTTTPHPAQWGQSLTLQTAASILTNFGDAQGSVQLHGLNSRTDLGISEWSQSKIIVGLPAKPNQPDPPYLISVDLAGAGGPQNCNMPVDIVDLIQIPPTPIPTMVALFENADFGGRMLVLTAGGPGEWDIVSKVRELQQQPLDVLQSPLLSHFLGILGIAFLTRGDNPRNVKFFNGTRLTDFWDYVYQDFDLWHARVSAEDIFSSLIFIGDPGKRLRVYNAPDMSDREGMFEITIGPERAVTCRDFGNGPQNPQTDPAGRLQVHRVPDFWKGIVHVETFNDEASSIEVL